MYKDFLPYLYTRHSIPSMIYHFCNPQLAERNLIVKGRVDSLLTYRSTIIDMDFRKSLLANFEALFDSIVAEYPSDKLSFELTGRVKALLSTLNKVEELELKTLEELRRKLVKTMFKNELKQIPTKLEQDLFVTKRLEELRGNIQFQDEFTKKLEDPKFVTYNPFERIHDHFAFRIVVEDKYPDELIDELYAIANLTISFFLNEGYDVIEHDPLMGTGNLLVNHNLIHVPPKSGIDPHFTKLVKDYVVCPKKLGYQGIHIVVRDRVSGRMFEIQLRTRTMDLIAETVASHEAYKQNKYGTQQEEESIIEWDRINVRAFRHMNYTDVDGNQQEYIFDGAGIKTALNLIRKKSGF